MPHPSRIQVLRSRRRRLLLEGDSGGGLPGDSAYVLNSAQSGVSVGYIGAGTLDPNTFNATTIGQFVGNDGFNQIDLWFSGSAQVGSTTTITLRVEGAPEDSYTLTWTGSRYQLNGGTAEAFTDYLLTQLGVDLNMTLTAEN